MCYQSLFKWWRHLHYWRNNSQRQFEHRNCRILYCCTFPRTAIQDSTVINAELEKVFDWLCINKLYLNINKTKFMIFHPMHKKLEPNEPDQTSKYQY